jgi:hypothetical protein
METRDKTASVRYIGSMPAKAKYPPLIRRRNPRTSVPVKQIREAVRKVVEMEKNDPVAYEAMVKRNAHKIVCIVPG